MIQAGTFIDKPEKETLSKGKTHLNINSKMTINEQVSERLSRNKVKEKRKT